MHFEQSSHDACCTPCKLNIVFALIITQVILFCYLLALDIPTILLFTLLPGVPIALLSRFLLSGKVKRYTKMTIVMFTAGGFGMLLGSVIDLGQVGVYGLLSICRTAPFSIFEWGADSLWQKFHLTPWSYIGMFVCGNLGMFLFDELHIRRYIALIKLFYIYAICNIGMLLGMLLGESVASVFTLHLNQFFAAGLMIISMLLGMVTGMITLLVLINRLTKDTLLPISFNYSACKHEFSEVPNKIVRFMNMTGG